MRIGKAGAWGVAAWLALAVLAGGAAARGDDAPADEGFVSLFNGKDLSGWRVGREVLDGRLESADGRFKAHDGAIVIQGGKPIKDLYTVREFPQKNLILRLEFRAAPGANSGLYIRGKQLQVRDYPTLGPYKDLKHYKNGGWNAIEVTVKPAAGGGGGIATCTCNGEMLEKELAVPMTGGIGLQSETNQIEYRRIRIKLEP
jgi:hypothetical protein